MMYETEATTRQCPKFNIQCLGAKCAAWQFSNLIDRKVYQDEQKEKSYARSRYNEPFLFDGAWWRYAVTGNDNKGVFDLIQRSIGDDEDYNKPRQGFCTLLTLDEED